MAQHTTVSEEKFNFTNKIKILSFVLMAVGLVAALVGIFTLDDHGARTWANFLLNNYYFMAISLCGVVFIAIHILGDSGWQVAIQRIPEAMSGFLPIASILMLFVIIGLIGNWHHLYHWAHLDHPDKIIEMKKAFLNIPFFTIRSLVYMIGWLLFAYFLRKYSVMQDKDGHIKYFNKSNVLAASFIAFFAVTSSTSAWDWVMSLDPHWFSTLFGWYLFSGLLVSGVAVIILITLFLKSQGYMKYVNNEHLHDLGKYLFAFSILWAYLWFSQYMLIWYSNIPEETIYFVQRLEDFKMVFFANLIINFAVPFLTLMTRNSKRTPYILGFVSIVVLVGHWLDYYMAVMPGSIGDLAKIGFVEVGMTIGYFGLFIYFVFRKLSKASLVPVNHPYLQESLEYHTQY